jgi:DNA repair and recombination protein RAD52
MTFTDKQTEELQAKLDGSVVKKNPRGYDYIEGWKAIAEANRIFGFGEWDRETVELKQLGEPYVNEKGNHYVNYLARVRIVVRHDGAVTVREGCGFGSGIDRDIGRSHESAVKEAETDAMKRALMTFGNPFGLALYDKKQADVDKSPPPSPKPSNEELDFIDAVNEQKSQEGVTRFMQDNANTLKALPNGGYERVRAVAVKALKTLPKEAA